MQSGNSMKKYVSVFLFACVCAIGGIRAAWGPTVNLAGLVVPPNALKGVSITPNDTVTLGYPLSSLRVEISKSDYDQRAGQHIGNTSFYYADTIKNEQGTAIKYYRYDVHWVYLAISEDGTQITEETTPTINALWQVQTLPGDAAGTLRYKSVGKQKWVRLEIENDKVQWSPVDDINTSSLITHQWTDIFSYTQDHRTFAYPLFTHNAQNYYLYYDKTLKHWKPTTDIVNTTIDPMYYEKWTLHKSLSLELDALLPAGTNHFDFVGKNETNTPTPCTITVWPTLADSTYIYNVPGKKLNYDNLHINEVVSTEDNINTLESKGYSFAINWRFFGGDKVNQQFANDKLTTYIPFANGNKDDIENSTYQAGAYNTVTYMSTDYADTALREIMKAELSKKGDTEWLITVTPQRWSPLNWWVKGIGWANFTDFIRLTVTKDKQVVANREWQMIRESRHYLEKTVLEPNITPTQHTFEAAGGSLNVTLTNVMKTHRIDLYDVAGYLIPTNTTIINSTELKPGTSDYTRQVSLQKVGSTDKPEWLNITSDVTTNKDITIQCGQNEEANSRLGILYSKFTDKTTGEISLAETRLFQKGRHEAGDVTFQPQGGWGYVTLDSTGRQKVHTTETTIYYHEGEEVELRLRERNFFGYMRWYDYHTGADPKYYYDSKDKKTKEHPNFWKRMPLKYIFRDGLWTGTNKNVEFDPINDGANDSHGLYFTMKNKSDVNSSINNRELKDDDSEEPKYNLAVYYDCPRLLVPIVNGWNPDKSNYPIYRDIACDVSNYTDYKEAWQTGTTDNVFREPTLSYRHIFHLRPAKEMADTLAKCVDGKYFEDYSYIAPIKTEVLLKTQYAHAYPVNSSRPSDLCYYFYIKNNNKKEMVRLDYNKKRRVVLYVNGKRTTQTYPSKSDYISVNSENTGTVTYELKIEDSSIGVGTIDGGKPICLARWTITYVNQSEYGPSKTELISRNEIAQNYIILAEKDFNYNKPGTKNMVLYDKPLDAEESSFGFCYPYSKAKGQSQRGTDGGKSTELDKNDPFPYYGEYAIVNAVGTKSPQGNVRSNWLKPTEQRGGAENGYCLYVDGSQRPGKVVTLSTNAKICSGQQLYCSAWICNPANDNTVASPVFRFDIEGRNPGGKWEAAGSFYTGEVGTNNGEWLQVRFPVVSANDYEESRITIYNYAATNSGNDFLVDDVMLYASRLPLDAYQATTSCKRGAINDKLVTMIKVDYNHFAGDHADQKLYYRIYDKTESQPVKTHYLNSDISSLFGSVQLPNTTFQPQKEDIRASVSEFVNEMSQYDNDTTCVKYIKIKEAGKERWVMYIAQLVNKSLLHSKKKYEIQTAYSSSDLDNSACAMRTALPVYEKTAFLFNGETYPATGQCANGLYPIDILVTDTIVAGGNVIPMQAYAKGDWLKGYDFDDIWYDAYLNKDTTGRRGAADVAFKQKYGYTRGEIEDAIKDMRREVTPSKPESNINATDVSQLQRGAEYWDNTDHYTIIYNLCQKGYLVLAKERQVVYMHSNDTVRYWVYPIARSAKTTYDGQEYTLNECAEPTFIKVFANESNYHLNLSNQPRNQQTTNDIPRARISLSAANSRFGIPIKEIGNDVAICYDSTQVVQSTDPIVSALIGKPNFSMHYTENKMYSDHLTDYYRAGDTIWFTPIDAAHVQKMKNRYQTENDKWTTGHPGLWVENTHSMRVGHEYTLRVQMMTRNQSINDAQNADCIVGYSPITVVVVPDTMIWTPTIADAQGRYSWADDRNWRGMVDGKTLTWGYTPISETMVILPTGLDKEKYPYIPEDKGDNILYPLDVNYHTNVCKKVQFRENALMLGQENLKYEQAYVDMVLPANDWYTMAAPLLGMYSGDLFIPHAGKYNSGTTQNLESEKEFEVSGFKGTRDSLAGYAFWAAYYNRDILNMYQSGENTIVNNIASFKTSNRLNEPLLPGQGFALAGFGPTDNETNLVVRLPKPDTKYTYFDNTGNPVREVLVDRTNAYRLGFTGDTTITLTVKNTQGASDPAQRGFLFGNPSMAYLDVFKLIDNNTSVLSQKGYQIEDKTSWRTIARNISTAYSDRFIAPMRSVILFPQNENATSIRLRVTPDCFALSLSEPNNTPNPAPRRTAGHTFRRDRMDIVAYTNGGRGYATLVAMDFANNGYDKDEDIRSITSGMGDRIDNIVLMNPVTVYTLAGNIPLAADVREGIGVVPLGFEIDNEYRNDSIDIFFSLNSVWSDECYLCDSETGERWRIYNDTHLRIATPANHEIRYYIQGEYLAPEGPDTPTDNGNTTIDTASSDVSAFSNCAEKVVVVATGDIAEIRMYDIAGRLLQEITPTNNTPLLTLQAPTGIVLLSTRLTNGFTAQNKVLVK